MSKPPSERCPKCGLPEGEVVEVRAQTIKPTRRASTVTPRIIGLMRITGVTMADMRRIVTVYRCKKCGHEFTKTTA